MTWRSRSAVVCARKSKLSAMCSVPARRATSELHGMGADSAQSTFTVELSYWKRLRLASRAPGTASGGSSSR
jgi:hypothetical protein